MLVADEAEMAGAVSQARSIDASRCRASVASRYDVAVTVAGYEHVYRQALGKRRAARMAGESRTMSRRSLQEDRRRGADAHPDCRERVSRSRP